jgi:hypothetical protein
LVLVLSEYVKKRAAVATVGGRSPRLRKEVQRNIRASAAEEAGANIGDAWRNCE